MSNPVDWIRERAYHIWEREGRPDGRALNHWLEAQTVETIDLLQSASGAPAANRRSATKRATSRSSAKDATAKDPKATGTSAKTASKKTAAKAKKR